MHVKCKYSRQPAKSRTWFYSLILLPTSLALAPATRVMAQLPEPRIGEVVPRDVREMYDRGIQFLANSQTAAGNWVGDVPVRTMVG